MKTTPVFQFPYVEIGDAARDYPATTKSMVEKIEAALLATGKPPVGSDLQSLLTRLNAVEGKLGDTGWVYPGLMNGWKNQTGQPMRYRRLNGFTLLQGYISGGSATPFLTIPVGFRPGQPIRVDTLSGTGSAATSMSFPVGDDGILAAGTGLSPNVNVFWPADK